MNSRTDLAVEKLEEVKTDISGTENECYYAAPVTFTKTRILTKEAAARIGKPIGEYLTAEIPDFTVCSDDFEELSEILAKEISSFLPCPLQTVLVIGLGNREITP
ncbi:MAG: GPR endopeptidase, partial [Clostridiales bacterium]|nr:GPR endopeptidase [Candidatus Equinaster intestinalis]